MDEGTKRETGYGRLGAEKRGRKKGDGVWNGIRLKGSDLSANQLGTRPPARAPRANSKRWTTIGNPSPHSSANRAPRHPREKVTRPDSRTREGRANGVPWRNVKVV